LTGGLAHASPTNRSCPEVGQRRRGRRGRPGRAGWSRPASAHHGGSTFRVAAHPSHHAPRTDHGRPPRHVRIGTHAPSLVGHGFTFTTTGSPACGSWWCGSASSWWLPSCGPFLRWLAPRCRLTTTIIHSTDEKDQTPFRAPGGYLALTEQARGSAALVPRSGGINLSCARWFATIRAHREGIPPLPPWIAQSLGQKARCSHSVPTRAGCFRPVNESPALAGLLCSGRYWARTSDPQLVELVLSQLS